MTAAESLSAGLAEHKAGNLALAARHYCRTLEQAPDNDNALHLLGLVLSEQGEPGRALSFLARAVELNPNATFVANLGLALRRSGDLEGAIGAYREALRMQPHHAPTLGRLGRALIDAGQVEEAELVLLQATAQQPADAELRNALGHARAAQKRYAEACADFAEAVALDPAFTEAAENCARAHLHCGHTAAQDNDWPAAREHYAEACRLHATWAEAWYHRGLAASALRALAEARDCYERAIQLTFDYAEAHNNLGLVFQAEGDVQEALRAFERALAIRPGYTDAQYNLALTLQNAGRVHEAESQYVSLLEFDPGHADTLNNLGGIYLSENRLEEAITHFETALASKPTHIDARWNLSLALLSRGDFRRGWPLYESRMEQAGFPRRDFSCPRWRHQILEGKRVCVWSEQGLGDTIQFLRYLPLLMEMGAQIIFEVQPRLYPLLRRLPGVEVVPRGETLPAFDYHIPLLSLPGCFEQIPPVWFPVEIPPPAVSLLAGYRVGLCWAGHPAHVQGRKRSIPLATLAGVASVDGVSFLSLQRGPAESEINSLSGTWRPQRIETEEGTVTDLASIICGLDLVITVDTMVAHLAGTLGRPVWTLLPFGADWRWLLEREDSPWYPGMRLFRQPRAGAWNEVVERVAAELRALTGRGNR